MSISSLELKSCRRIRWQIELSPNCLSTASLFCELAEIWLRCKFFISHLNMINITKIFTKEKSSRFGSLILHILVHNLRQGHVTKASERNQMLQVVARTSLLV
jgi:hypothetical protein